MVHRGFALLIALLAYPAHATLLEYSFSATLYHPNYAPRLANEAFGAEVGDRITGGFLFDDAAPRTSYTAWPDGESTSTYDMSDLWFWVTVGDHVLGATGSELTIRDDPPPTVPNDPYGTDRWTLSMLGDGNAVNGYTIDSMMISLMQFGSVPLTSSELQVPNPSEWSQCCYPNVPIPFRITFTDGSIIAANRLSISSVPEPATLSLLAAGVLGALATRRRKRAAAKVC